MDTKTFGGEAAVARELDRLRDMNRHDDHFELGAYHNALLYAVLPDQLEALNDASRDVGLMKFCAGRYQVRDVDVDALVDTVFEDTDFKLPRDVVNAFAAGEKYVLGLDDGVFGVANALKPHREDLLPRPASRTAVEPIFELTPAREAELRRRHRAAPKAAWGELEAMGVAYQRGQTFPYWPEWLQPE